MDPELGEEVHHVWVRAEEDVQPCLDPVAVLVLPGTDLAAEHIPRLEDQRRVPRVREVLGAREAGEATPDDRDLLLLPRLLRLPRASRQLLGKRQTLPVRLRILELAGLGEVLHADIGRTPLHALRRL